MRDVDDCMWLGVLGLWLRDVDRLYKRKEPSASLLQIRDWTTVPAHSPRLFYRLPITVFGWAWRPVEALPCEGQNWYAAKILTFALSALYRVVLRWV